jgi:hypothetical protein
METTIVAENKTLKKVPFNSFFILNKKYLYSTENIRIGLTMGM